MAGLRGPSLLGFLGFFGLAGARSRDSGNDCVGSNPSTNFRGNSV